MNALLKENGSSSEVYHTQSIPQATYLVATQAEVLGSFLVVVKYFDSHFASPNNVIHDFLAVDPLRIWSISDEYRRIAEESIHFWMNRLSVSARSKGRHVCTFESATSGFLVAIEVLVGVEKSCGLGHTGKNAQMNNALADRVSSADGSDVIRIDTLCAHRWRRRDLRMIKISTVGSVERSCIQYLYSWSPDRKLPVGMLVHHFLTSIR